MADMSEITGYDLSRNWFDWCFENPELINPNHTALYFFIIEHCNRMGWKEKFGLPSEMTMNAIGVKNWKTYKKSFEFLVTYGFIKVLERSKNQYSANVIAIVKNTKAHTKALSKAIQKHSQKQVKSTVGIDKPINLLTIEPINLLSNKNSTAKYWSHFIEKFESWYLEKTGNKYSYLAKDFKSLKKIHSFFEKRSTSKKIEFTEQYLLAAFDFFLNKAWDKDQWLRDNFSIPNLLNQFNQIQNSVINGKRTSSRTNNQESILGVKKQDSSYASGL